MPLSTIGTQLVFLVCVIAAGALGIAVPIGVRRRARPSTTHAVLSAGNAFGGGVFLAAGLIHLLPDSVAQFPGEAPGSYPYAFTVAAASFAVVLCIERLIGVKITECATRRHRARMAALAVKSVLNADERRTRLSASPFEPDGELKLARPTSVPVARAQVFASEQLPLTAAFATSPAALALSPSTAALSGASAGERPSAHGTNASSATASASAGERPSAHGTNASSVTASVVSLEIAEPREALRHQHEHRPQQQHHDSPPRPSSHQHQHHEVCPDSTIASASMSAGPSVVATIELPELMLTSPAASYLLLIALAVHSVLAGLALGVDDQVSQAIPVFIAIMAHKSVAAAALCIAIIRGRVFDRHRRRAIGMLTIFVLSTPIGIAMGIALRLTQTADDTSLEAWFKALAAGTFLYVSTVDMMADEFVLSRSWLGLKYAMFALGLTIMAVIALWT